MLGDVVTVYELNYQQTNGKVLCSYRPLGSLLVRINHNPDFRSEIGEKMVGAVKGLDIRYDALKSVLVSILKFRGSIEAEIEFLKRDSKPRFEVKLPKIVVIVKDKQTEEQLGDEIIVLERNGMIGGFNRCDFSVGFYPSALEQITTDEIYSFLES